MLVIGTAGHIDHGKSSLIIRLTGIDPDRLPEEKQRGMTIDLGFAWYDTANGQRIGIVDVPGHERFVRNMIAGAGGIDAVLLVVAADDGWMPQSQEHLQIIRLLGINYGIVVITKIDLVERSWVDLVEEDIRERLRGTFLETAPFIRASSATGEGFDELRSEIDKLANLVTSREDIGKLRLFIDRAFILQGMGGVATGTLRGGALRVGQEVAIFPSRKKGKIRTIQSHNQQVESSSPGQRTAVSLTGIEKDELSRGNVISMPEIVEKYATNPVFALNVSVIPEAAHILENRRRLLMILGTTEVEGEIRLFDKTEIRPGEDGILFFRPSFPILAFVGDRFIFRLPTPQVTIGGGSVLDIIAEMPRHKDMEKFGYLRERFQLTPRDYIKSSLSKSLFIDPQEDFLFSDYSQAQISTAIDEELREGSLAIYEGKLYRPESIKEIKQKIIMMVEEYFKNHSHIDGLSSEEISPLAGVRGPSLDLILQLMSSENALTRKKNRYDLPGREIVISGELKKAADSISEILKKSEFTPPAMEEIIGGDKSRKEAFEFLVASGTIVKIGGGLAFHKENWQQALAVIKELLESGGQFSISAFRERLNSTRKYVVPILEETDRLGITERQGDVRIRGSKYDEA